MTQPAKRPKKLPLSDAKRLKRFKDMAREVEAEDDPDAFDRAFTKVVTSPKD